MKALKKLWKEDLTFVEFSKEIGREYGTYNLVIVYFIIITAIVVGLLI